MKKQKQKQKELKKKMEGGEMDFLNFYCILDYS